MGEVMKREKEREKEGRICVGIEGESLRGKTKDV